jgi:hypothetical protein
LENEGRAAIELEGGVDTGTIGEVRTGDGMLVMDPVGIETGEVVGAGGPGISGGAGEYGLEGKEEASFKAGKGGGATGGGAENNEARG